MGPSTLYLSLFIHVFAFSVVLGLNTRNNVYAVPHLRLPLSASESMSPAPSSSVAFSTSSSSAAFTAIAVYYDNLALWSGYDFPDTSSPLLPSSSLTPLESPTTVYEEQTTTATATVTATVTLTVEIPSTTTIETPTPTPSSTNIWIAPTHFTDLGSFNVAKFPSGPQNMKIVDQSALDSTDDMTPTSFSDADGISYSLLQLFYPATSINPGNAQYPVGGSEFYATPLSFTGITSVTLQYSVFFPSDFEWVLGGKLPGLYGGHYGCSGGDAANDCFSTRMMWRENGAGELYLYAPKTKQTPSLCSAPPKSVCNSDYGFSIGRGSFYFNPGSWTTIKQTVRLNTPGIQNGGFTLEVNGKLIMDRADVFYRDVPPAPARTSTLQPSSTTTSLTPTPTESSGGLLSPLLGGLFHLSGPQQGSNGDNSDPPTVISPSSSQGSPLVNVESPAGVPVEGFSRAHAAEPEAVGFLGIFFSTFFGGNTPKYASPKDQYTWFGNFSIIIND